MKNYTMIAESLDKIQNAVLGCSTRVTRVGYLSDGVFVSPDGKGEYGDIPEFYRVECISEPEEGSYIRTEIWVPAEWNGIFVGLGNGGIAGNICYHALAEQVRGGYAAANTDMGTSRGFYLSGIKNEAVPKDFGWRATHIMTEIGKAAVRLIHGRSPLFSYFIGASTGGQQALSEAQRFPCDYDGIIAAVPANNRIFLHTYFLWNYVHLRTRDGRRLFTPSEVELLTALAVEFFQSKGDGERGDRFVTMPWCGDGTVEEFLRFLAVNHGDFTDEQLNALRAVYGGPVDPRTGKRIYNGMPIGSEKFGCGINDCSGDRPPHYYPFMWVFGADYDPYSFDFGGDMDTVDSLLSCELNANSADITEFTGRGGKLIAYSGSADPCVPYPDALAYMKRVFAALGGDEAAFESARYFIIPGMDHGGGGDGANRVYGENGKSLLDSLRLWREGGTAPEHLTAVRLEPEQNWRLSFSRKVSYCTSSTVGAPAWGGWKAEEN